MDYFKIYSFSPNNAKANIYNTMRRKLANMQNEIKGYENSSAPVNPERYKKLVKEYDALKTKLTQSLTSAKREEHNLQNVNKQRIVEQNNSPPISPELGRNLNILA